MNKTTFIRENSDSLIIVKAKIGIQNVHLAVDTGASHTVIDLSTLITLGYFPENAVGAATFETGKGNVDSLIFRLDGIFAVGEMKRNFEVSAYDFLANGVLSEFEGVLGLDFFEGLKMCIDFRKSEIVIT